MKNFCLIYGLVKFFLYFEEIASFFRSSVSSQDCQVPFDCLPLVRADRIAQRVKGLAAKPVDLSSSPRPYKVGESDPARCNLLLYVST